MITGNDLCQWCGASYDSTLHAECAAELDPPSPDCTVCGKPLTAFGCEACDVDPKAVA